MPCVLSPASSSPLAAAAQTWPAKPIRMLIPYPAGGTSDILARMISPKLTEVWGPQIIVDNRVGANGNIAMDLTVRAPADGYTLVLNDLGNLAISPSMYSKLPFDIIRDLTPVAMVSYSAHLLTVHPSVPVKTVKEIIALAKANPGKLNMPVGLGAAVHLAGLSLEQRTGAKWVYVPTKGGQASIMTVATGEGDLLFMGMLQTLPHVKSGRLKLIAVSSEKRDPNLPNVPTVSETPGLEGFVTGSYQGIVGPAKLPADVVSKINAEVNRIIGTAEIKEKLAGHGTVPLPMSPQDMGKWLSAEKERWAKVVKTSGFKID
ncbi:MAG TPA: tripartite tricarboxylate transporter substrate binding protein [Burkholderiales bacterium]|nr:tripartite tricarboxylate transporter substrate binding protein [Burkholderiales bacterium]